MGMYDSVYCACPSCAARIEIQSKAGRCMLNNYTLWDAPAAILGDLAGTRVFCGKCDRRWVISVVSQAVLTPAVELPEYEDEEYDGNPSKYTRLQ